MSTLDRLRGGLIVSVQPESGSPLAMADAVALLARVAERNGAAGIRTEGTDRIRAVRTAVGLPVIGIIKRVHEGFGPYITSTVAEVEEVLAAGADVVAFDATERPHADGASVQGLVAAVHAGGRLAMADCSTLSDARAAIAARSDIIATTLAGYTEGTQGTPLPALELVSALCAEHPFVVCEGGIAAPKAGRAAFAAGASAIVVGTAIANIDARVRAFVPR